MTAAWAFVTSGIVYLSPRPPLDFLMIQTERVCRELVDPSLGDVIEYNRLHTLQESFVHAFSSFSRPSRSILVMGAVTLFLRIEEAVIRPALPTIVSAVYLVILSAGPLCMLGAVFGHGTAYVARKCNSFFITREWLPDFMRRK